MAENFGTYAKGNDVREAADAAQVEQLRFLGFKKVPAAKAAAKAADPKS